MLKRGIALYMEVLR